MKKCCERDHNGDGNCDIHKVELKDFFGSTIKVGDTVAFMQRNYRHLLLGEVIRLSNKMVTIKHRETNVCSTETRQFAKQVIVKPKE